MNKLENFDIFPGKDNGFSSGFGNEFIVFEDFLYFSASEKSQDEELWRIGLNPGDKPEEFTETDSTDSINNSSFLKSKPTQFTVVGDALFFTAFDGNKRNIYKTDGENRNQETTIPFAGSEDVPAPNRLIAVGSDLFFFGFDITTGSDKLYKIDTEQNDLKAEVAVVDIDFDRFNVNNLIEFNDTFYFTSSNAAFGTELYKFEVNKFTRKDITEGSKSSNPNNLIVVGDNLYFFADPDGDLANFKLFKQSGEGGDPEELAKTENLDINRNAGLIEVNGKLYFASSNRLFEFDPAKPDEASELTQPQAASIEDITKAGNFIYFTVGSDKLFRYDTTADQGTDPNEIDIVTNNPGIGNLDNLLVIDDTLYFTADATSTGNELYQLSISDSQASPKLVGDINPDAGNSNPRSLFNANGNLFFVANDGANAAANPDSEGIGTELWKLSNAESPIRLVSELQEKTTEGSIPPLPNQDFAYDSNSKTLYFIGSGFLGDDPNRPTGNELWKLDNSNPNAEPELVEDLDLGEFDLKPENLFLANNTLYFVARESFNTDFRLWQSDGTADNTKLADQTGSDFTFANTPTGNAPLPGSFLQVDNTLYFSAEKTGNPDNKGFELFTFNLNDPSSEVTEFNTEILAGNGNPNIRNLTQVGDAVYFVADLDNIDPNLPNDNNALFKVQNGNISKFDNITSIQDLTVVADTVYFTGEQSGDRKLWQSQNGNDPSQVEDTEDLVISSNSESLIFANNALYFTADNSVNNNQLYKFDLGSSTKELIDSNDVSAARNFTLVDDTLYFTATNGNDGRELWKVDTTSDDPTAEQVKDINPDGDSNPQNLTAINGYLFFTAIDDPNGRELWQTDGEETKLLQDLYPGSPGSNPTNLLVADNQLYFTADDGTTGLELWSVAVKPPTIAFQEASISQAEGNEGNTEFTFTLSLSETSTRTISVDYSTADDTATAGEDYTAASDTLEFAPGEKDKTITIEVTGDTDFEPDETFTINLSNPVNGEITDTQGVATITNDDSEPVVDSLNININRFQNEDVPGTYLFAGEEESASIRDNFPNFIEEGLAFQVADEPADDLIPLYRFQSLILPGTYLFAGEDERASIKENFSESFVEEGLAFYVYGAGTGKGTEFTRFQNSEIPGTYLFAGPEESQTIRDNFPSFIEEGAAFEVAV